jgi:hypothetical protein
MQDLSTVNDHDLINLSRIYEQVVIWGRNIAHTHYWITSAYFNALTDLGVPCLWLDDSEASANIPSKNSFYIFNSYDTKCISLLKPKAFLAFRRNQFPQHILDHLANYSGVYQHQQHLDEPLGVSLGCHGQVFYDPKQRLLQQPWGTDLLAERFLGPCFSTSNYVYWTGSIWKQPAHIKTPEWGNTSEIYELAQSLKKQGITLIQLQDAYRDINIGFIRNSRIAPAIQGLGQVKARHLACRFFKNISYGHFCISNNPAAKDLLGDSCIYHSNIEQLVDKALSVDPIQAQEMCASSQLIIRGFTIASGLARALAIIEMLG